MTGDWSAHLEFTGEGTRVRTDFVTRPPRPSPEELASLWQEQEGARLPHVDVRRLIELKKTNREKDYAVIGELARKLVDPEAQLASSRSARDILDLRERHPGVFVRAALARPALAAASAGREALEAALDAERRRLMRRNERRLAAYLAAAGPWADRWRALMPSLRGVPLERAHALVVSAAEGVLPFDVSWDDGDA